MGDFMNFLKNFLKTKKGKIITVATVLLIVLVIRHFYNESLAFHTPSYEKKDISATLNKKNLTDKDFMFIFEQTGVSPGAAKNLIENGEADTLLKLNDLYFEKPDFKKTYIAYPVTVEERNDSQVTPLADIQTGDILVTFNTHTLDWRHGHCGLVLDAEKGLLLEHMAIGQTSCITRLSSWGEYPAFAVLRHPDSKINQKAVKYAQEHLIDIEYNIFAGFFKKDKSDEDKPSSSHCSHIVWQAYKAQGVDIDNNKGIFVTPKNISRSKELKVVQIYGLNPKDYKSRILK